MKDEKFDLNPFIAYVPKTKPLQRSAHLFLNLQMAALADNLPWIWLRIPLIECLPIRTWTINLFMIASYPTATAWIKPNIVSQDELGGRHCTEVAFVLHTQPARVRFLAFLRFFPFQNFLMYLRFNGSALLRELVSGKLVLQKKSS